MRLIITGSLAFDHIMDFPGRFSEHILPDKIHILNLSFLVETFEKRDGGVAGNICYSLSLLGESPILFAAVGNDFSEYKKKLDNLRIDTSNIYTEINDVTSSFYVTTDLADNQISAFYPGAMNKVDSMSLRDLSPSSRDFVLIGATKPSAMVKFVSECQEMGLTYIYDPAQQVAALSKDDLRKGIEKAKVVIGNDYEIQLILNKTRLTEKEILDKVDALITTLGDKGSIIKTKEKEYKISVSKPKKVTDPTGAGDAYRAGLIKGLKEGWDYEKIGKAASVAASFAIEQYGTQEHKFTKGEFEERYEENYGERIKI